MAVQQLMRSPQAAASGALPAGRPVKNANRVKAGMRGVEKKQHHAQSDHAGHADKPIYVNGLGFSDLHTRRCSLKVLQPPHQVWHAGHDAVEDGQTDTNKETTK